MVASLDGFIGKHDGDVSWMESHDRYEQGTALTEAEIVDFLKSIDCYVMGAKTYEHALELGWPYADTPVVVVTHRALPRARETVSFYAGDLNQLVYDHLKPAYRNIWMVGGATLTREFIRLQLADEIVVSIIPTLLGEGIPFFDQIGIEQPLHLKETKAYQDGMVELRYALK